MPTFRPRNLRVGAMRYPITIKQPVETLDDYGEPIVTWSTYLADEPASFEPTGGIESMRGRQLEAGIQGVFTVRFRDGYSTQMKITHNSQDYGIKYIHAVDGGRRYLELFVAASGDL